MLHVDFTLSASEQACPPREVLAHSESGLWPEMWGGRSSCSCICSAQCTLAVADQASTHSISEHRQISGKPCASSNKFTLIRCPQEHHQSVMMSARIVRVYSNTNTKGPAISYRRDSPLEQHRSRHATNLCSGLATFAAETKKTRAFAAIAQSAAPTADPP